MENKTNTPAPVIYDYRTIRIKRELEAMATDAYESLGWSLVGSSVADGAIFHVNLSFKRDRKIASKPQLLAQQEKVDEILTNIEILQSRRKTAGLASSIGVGSVGAITFGGGMSLCLEFGTRAGYFMAAGIATGITGLGILALAWLVRGAVKRRRGALLTPIIETEYNKLADVCEVALS